MSLIGNRVLLGYEDEAVTDKYRDQVDYTTNKIGGLPNWPGDAPTAVTCKLCGLNLPLVLQIYAPLNGSSYHRTLYIFACINPNCWNQNGSWVCLRSQILAETNDTKVLMNNEAVGGGGPTDMWNLAGADNWGDEENGNVVDFRMTSDDAAQLTQGMDKLTFDERNANSGASAAEGATGCVPMATATIEGGDEAEVVTIDSPITPHDNIIALLEEAAPMPQVPISSLHFASAFIAVAEEDLTRLGNHGAPGSPSTEEHIRELMKTCKVNEELSYNASGGSNGRLSPAEENYEKSLPAHGDKLFFQFVSRIQANPGQILRYGGYPLLLYPMPDRPNLCRHCGGQLLYEMQVLPTLLSRLKLIGSNFEDSNAHLEFGSVYVFSCGSSCWDSRDSYREETLVVQMEKICSVVDQDKKWVLTVYR